MIPVILKLVKMITCEIDYSEAGESRTGYFRKLYHTISMHKPTISADAACAQHNDPENAAAPRVAPAGTSVISVC